MDQLLFDAIFASRSTHISTPRKPRASIVYDIESPFDVLRDAPYPLFSCSSSYPVASTSSLSASKPYRSRSPPREPRDTSEYYSRSGNPYSRPRRSRSRSPGYRSSHTIKNISGTGAPRFADSKSLDPVKLDTVTNAIGYKPERCAVDNCENPAQVGGHLKADGDSKWLVGPECKAHNNPANKETMPLRPGAEKELVYVNRDLRKKETGPFIQKPLADSDDDV